MSNKNCPICGCDFKLFKDVNGRKKIKCGICGSLERQRSLYRVWMNHFNDYNCATKDILLIGPANCERKFFKDLNFNSIVTTDVRPESKCDIIADICKPDNTAYGKYDIVFASHVFVHLYDLDVCLANIRNMLSDDGLLLSHTPTHANVPTVVNDDEALISRNYGVENLKKYGIGNFKRYGELDLLRVLQKYFINRTFFAADNVSGAKFMWVCSHPPQAADMTIRR